MEFGETTFYPKLDKYAEADVLVLAGDVHNADSAPSWIHQNFGPLGIPIVYIAGNHEFYHGHWDNSLKFLREECRKYPEIHFLENDSWLHPAGVRFMGATLWTNFSLHDNPKLDRHVAQMRMNDYRRIAIDNRTLSTDDIASRFTASIGSLEAMLSDRPEGIVDVVVTHHAPHKNSIDDSYVDEELESCYATNQEALIKEYAPEYWLHGHIHGAAKYDIGKTKIRSNPGDYFMNRFEDPTPLVLTM
jgi:Icc-related predicted phosphoesterase